MRWTKPRGENGHGGSISSPLIATTNRPVCVISFITRIRRTIARETIRSAWRAPGGASVTRHLSVLTVVTWCAVIADIGRWRTQRGNDVTAPSIGAVRSRATSARKRKHDTRACEEFLSSPTIGDSAGSCVSTRWHAVARGGTRWHAVASSERTFPPGGVAALVWQRMTVWRSFWCEYYIKTIAKFGASRPELDPYQWAGTVYFRVSTTKKQFSWMHDKNVCYEWNTFDRLSTVCTDQTIMSFVLDQHTFFTCYPTDWWISRDVFFENENIAPMIRFTVPCRNTRSVFSVAENIHCFSLKP